MGHRQTWINSTSPRMLKATVIEIKKQLIGIDVIQSPNVIITTTRVETIVAPNKNVVWSGILIGSVTNLGNRSVGVLTRRNLSRSSTLPTTTTKVVGTP